MILAGDIGGTKSILGLFDPEKISRDGRNAPLLLKKSSYSNDRYEGLEPIISDFLNQAGLQELAVAVFGVAGPVFANKSEPSNLSWTIDGESISKGFNIPDVHIINDLAAAAEGIPAMKQEELLIIQEGLPGNEAKTAALIAPGTGLGMAVLHTVDDQRTVFPSEGGHADLAAPSVNEWKLLKYLHGKYVNHLSIERVLCGYGVYELYRYVVDIEGMPENENVEKQAGIDDRHTPEIISDQAFESRCPACAKALEIFLKFFGAAAGNLALISLAYGGVFLGGGISPKILPHGNLDIFIQAFNAKGRLEDVMKKFPVKAIMNQEIALWGAALHGSSLLKKRKSRQS